MMPTSLCNHTSAGVIVRWNSKILMFDRPHQVKAGPSEHADELPSVPQGHLREEPFYRLAAARLLREQTGILVGPERLINLAIARDSDRCTREIVDRGRPWHLWHLYVLGLSERPAVRGSDGVSDNLAWYSADEIAQFERLDPAWRNLLAVAGVLR